LLQHDFGNPNLIGNFIFTPRKRTFVFAVPLKKFGGEFHMIDFGLLTLDIRLSH